MYDRRAFGLSRLGTTTILTVLKNKTFTAAVSYLREVVRADKVLSNGRGVVQVEHGMHPEPRHEYRLSGVLHVQVYLVAVPSPFRSVHARKHAQNTRTRRHEGRNRQQEPTARRPGFQFRPPRLILSEHGVSIGGRGDGLGVWFGAIVA